MLTRGWKNVNEIMTLPAAITPDFAETQNLSPLWQEGSPHVITFTWLQMALYIAWSAPLLPKRGQPFS